MALDLTQAKAALASLVSGSYTTNDLLNLARQVDISATGSVTILYSGTVNGEAAYLIAKEMAEDSDIRVIDKTQAAKFLQSDEFMIALGRTQGIDPNDMLNGNFTNPAKQALLDWLYDGKIGPWAETSGRFVDATTGKVKILTEDPRGASVLLQTELPKLVEKFTTGTDITEVEGITREKLIGFSDLTDLRNTLLTRAAHDVTLSKVTTNSFAAFVGMTNETYETLFKAASGSADDMIKMGEAAQRFKIGSATLKALPMIGTAFFILASLSTSAQAAQASVEGREDEALHILEDFGAEWAGSTVAQAAAGAVATAGLLLSGVALASPVGIATVLVATVAGGYFGGDWGKELIYLFQDRSEEQKRDTAMRMLKLIFGDDVSLGSAVPDHLASKTLMIDTTFSRKEMVEAAKADIAWRYALRELNPFVISNDALYTKHNTDGSLDLYDETTGQGSMSDMYLQDRAAMLTWKLRYDKEKTPYTSQYNTSEIDGNWDFVDMASDLTLAIDGNGLSLSDHQIVFGTKTADSISGGGDCDHLYGMTGDDTLDGGEGDDYLEGNAGSDVLTGGEGRDTLLGGAGDDTLEGGKDNDLLIGGLGDDVYRYTTGDGYDTIRDADGKFSIVIDGQTLTLANAVVDNGSTWKSEDGKHTFVATGDISQGCTLIVDGVIAIENFKIDQGGLTLNPAKPVTSPSWSGGDTADLQASHAAIQDAGADTFKLNGLAGNDLLAGTDNHIWDPDNPGQWITTGQAIRDYLDGGQGKDWLFGDAGDDTLVGGSGDDLIIGGSGRDILDGGAENDLLMGFGAERYYAFLGRIEDGGVTLGPEDQDLERFLWSQIEFRFSLSSVELINDIETGRIRETHRIDLGGAVSGTVPAGISWYDEAAGRRFAPVAYEFTPAVSGSSRGDIVFTDDQGRTQSWQYLMGRVDATRSVVALDSGFGSQAGGIFNDPVDDSPDILQGAGGQDTLIGGGGNDTLVGGEDDDVLLSNGGADLLVGGGGKDFLAGGDGQDRLEGNGGDDTLYGEDADDLLDGGEGNDTLCGDFSTGRATGNGNDTLNGDDGNDWLYGNGGDDVLFGGKDDDKLFGDADDTPLTAIGNDTLDGGAGNDSLLGFGGDDRLDGGAGNDNLYGDVGNDVLLGGTGNDAMSGGEGNDILIGDSGDDGLWGDAGNDNLIGGDGDDDLTGGDGDDTLIGGSGTDCLNGGLGNDTYVLGAGDGALDATGSIEAINDVAGNNSLSFTNATAEGIACSSVNAGIDLRIDYGGDGHVLVVGGMHGAISRFVLADGTVWTNDDIRNQLLKGSSGNDVIMGASTDDHLHGQTGNDVLQGGIGNDTLSGDTGNDLLLGGEGTDLYVFNLGDGQDTLVDTIDGNIIRFGEAISRSSLQIADVTYLDETDSPVRAVSVRYGTTNDTLLIRDGLLGRIERFEFADGSSLSWRDVVAGLPSLNVVGSDGNDHAIGSSQNDTLVGAKGDDRLEGMGGDDYLVGGEGGNSYVWG